MATTLFSPPAPLDTLAKAPPRTPPDPLGLELRRPGEDLWAAILPNPSHPARPYKIQYFASFGLAGHQVHATPAAALADVLADGFTEPDPGALERLSQTPAWRARYDTPAAAPTLTPALRQVLKALARLEQEHATVETVTLRRGRVPPRIVVSTPVPVLTWRCYVWGHDRRGRYRRLTASLEGCQVVREVRDGPARPPCRR